MKGNVDMVKHQYVIIIDFNDNKYNKTFHCIDGMFSGNVSLNTMRPEVASEYDNIKPECYDSYDDALIIANRLKKLCSSYIHNLNIHQYIHKE
jgi:hypothetical protein